ncbi:MAG TPA: SusC/RagA family TonB-linked outer membrane protein [Puia sp.]|jgi:TonB-linked SusC/RagA family outer membrane protein|nr:SusC/RagA family TonB-linked outer membrane protein [Puia sp.]
MSKKIPLLAGVLLAVFLLPLGSFAQSVIVGRVLSKIDQSPLPGITVSIKGTKTGTATGIDGAFAIKAKVGDMLVISGIGIERMEQEVTGNTLVISVGTNSRELSQVVVTATGIRKEAKRLGYAIQTVDASTLTTAREADPVNSLKGEAAGLQININSEIGHAPDVIMRGENGSDDRPLFVVDGVPISSDTYNVNPDDIETFTVLKGPNAAALYGFQGKNGAIIISTKKGTKDKRGLAVNLNTSTQINKGFIALPKYQDLYGPGDNGKYAFGGGGSSPSSYFGSGAVGVGINDYDYDVWGPQFRGQLLPQYDGVYDPTQTYTTTFADGSNYKGHVAPTPFVARGTNNLKKFIQAGLLSSNSISIASSTEKTDFRASLANIYQRGIVPNTELNNTNATISLVHRPNQHFSITTYFNYSRQASPNVPDVQYGPNSIIYNIIIWGGADWAMKDMRNYWQPGHKGVEQLYEEYYRYNNPYFMSYEWLRGHYQNNEYGYLSLNYKVNENLDFQFRPSMTAYDMTNSEKMPYSAGVYGRPLRQGDYREDRRSQFESNWDLQARYHRNEIAGFLDLSVLAGATVREFNFNSSYESTNYLNVPGTYAFSNSLNPVQGTSFDATMLTLSAYYSVDLGYKSYVTASITGREDKSSTLPSNTNGYFYPSFNLATVISDYTRMPGPISFLKLKASYAESKNGGTTPLFAANLANVPAANGYGYNWSSAYDGPNPGYPFQQSQYTLSPTYSAQSSATYATTSVSPTIFASDRQATEFGADIRFVNNRIGLDVTHYHYRNTLIVAQGTSPSSGFSANETNGDVYTNDGWEAVLTGKPFVNPKGFSWTVTANFFTYIRKWVNNSNPDNWEFNGRRVDLNYGDGFVRTPDGKLVIDPSSGIYLRYSDLGSAANRIYGHGDPDWQWGLINTVSYKSFSLRFQFDGMVGGVIEDYVRVKTLQGGRHIEAATGAIGAARPSDEANIPAYVGPGVNLIGAPIAIDPINGSITNMKQLTEQTNTTKSLVQPFVYNAASIADLNMISKTYTKLREVTLTYTLPQQWVNRSFIQNASVSFVGRNLLYFFPSRYKDLDVDQYSQNIVAPGQFANSSYPGLQTPTTRNFGFNLNLTF